jgi:hypothetical protein
MNVMRRIGDRLIDAAARRVLAWSVDRVEPDRRPWIEAISSELDLVESGPARLVWALGGLTVVCRTRRSTLIRTWRSWPALFRTMAFGLALGAAMLALVVWSNVVVPSHESDSEYTAWYLVLYAGLFAYFTTSGFMASRGGGSITASALTGGATALVGIGIAMLTFVVIDNLFLDVVMRQPDKLHAFQSSGLTDPRAFVNRGLVLGLVIALPVISIIGAGCGTLGGALAERLRLRPAGAA